MLYIHTYSEIYTKMSGYELAVDKITVAEMLIDKVTVDKIPGTVFTTLHFLCNFQIGLTS
jgi:hypothetical protein